MREVLTDIVLYYNLFVLFYFLTINFSYLTLLTLGADRLIYFSRRRRTRICAEKHCKVLPSVALLIPAYNEEKIIAESVRSFLKVDYPNLELLVINDGSKDKTLEVLKSTFKLTPVPRASSEELKTAEVKGLYRSVTDPRLFVVDKVNGGKSDALNAGLNYSRSKLYAGVDADSLLDRDAIKRLIRPYLERDAKVLGLGGIIMPANDSVIEDGQVVEPRVPKKFLPAMQAMEYIRAFLGGRAGWSKLGSLLIISGAFAMFERREVLKIGGYRTETVGEDMDVVVRLHRKNRKEGKDYRMVFIPDPVCWTQVPHKLSNLATQRNRWQRGLIESLTHNLGMMFNPRYGRPGMLGMPFHFFYEMLGPVVEFTGYLLLAVAWILGIVNWKFALVFFILAVVFGVLLSLYALLLAEFTVKKYRRPGDILKLFLLAVAENFGYRQLVSWFRLTALFGIKRRKKRWGKIKRTGFDEGKHETKTSR